MDSNQSDVRQCYAICAAIAICIMSAIWAMGLNGLYNKNTTKTRYLLEIASAEKARDRHKAYNTTIREGYTVKQAGCFVQDYNPKCLSLKEDTGDSQE